MSKMLKKRHTHIVPKYVMKGYLFTNVTLVLIARQFFWRYVCVCFVLATLLFLPHFLFDRLTACIFCFRETFKFQIECCVHESKQTQMSRKSDWLDSENWIRLETTQSTTIPQNGIPNWKELNIKVIIFWLNIEIDTCWTRFFFMRFGGFSLSKKSLLKRKSKNINKIGHIKHFESHLKNSVVSNVMTMARGGRYVSV